jgi:demethylmenaquinone methyltransferase/2-methoxy-6-polyprenyl-1,4-benzoquinol methylase
MSARPDDEQGELFSYYEAQADSYEEFYEGRGQAIGALAREYPVDTAAIANLLSGFGRGNVVDLACGTGFWLTAYGQNCTSVTLVDQAPAALAKCQQRVDQLGLQAKARLVQGDIFKVALGQVAYDACVLGFLLSHLPDLQVTDLFRRLRTILRPDAELAVVDGAWSDARKPYRQRDGFERRALGDNRSFMIRKKYFERVELETLLEREGFPVRSAYVGNVFIAVVARRAL